MLATVAISFSNLGAASTAPGSWLGRQVDIRVNREAPAAMSHRFDGPQLSSITVSGALFAFSPSTITPIQPITREEAKDEQQ